MAAAQPTAASQQGQFDSILGAVGTNCRYENLRSLGKGSFGQTYLVRRKSDGLTFCAKSMDLSTMTSKDQKYVEAEIQCLASCNHFAVIQYQEDFTEGTNMLILMEYADAGDLNQQIKSRASEDFRYFEEHEVGYTLVQLLLAIDHIHRRKMLHRDIKGANVLLMSSGLIKLGDFGFSQIYEDTVSGAVAGTFCGTPYYLAPEIWKRQKYSKRADIWSLGILLYEMMALKRPFSGQGMRALQDSVVAGVIPPLPDCFSLELRNICLSFLRADPNARPTTTEVLLLPYMAKVLSDFERTVVASPLIAATTKALVADNIKEFRDSARDNPGGGAIGPCGAIQAHVNYESPIRKESGGVWKERYFLLADGQLVISVKKGDKETKGISVAMLASVVPVPFHVAKAEGVFALNTLDNKTMWMQAPSRVACQEWIHHIQQAMGVA